MNNIEEQTTAQSEELLPSDPFKMISKPEMQLVFEMYAKISREIRDYLSTEQDFLEFKPPLIGPVTDPGARGAKPVTIDFYGKDYKFMSSAILYKQLLSISRKAAGLPGKIFFFADNLRMEPLETANTDRHLAEFIQVDLEIVDADHFEAMEVAEGLVTHIYKQMKEYEPQLSQIWDAYSDSWEKRGLTPRSQLKVPTTSFERYTFKEAINLLQDHIDQHPELLDQISDLFNITPSELDYDSELSWEYEWLLSTLHDQPFFVHDYPKGARGFYDREYSDKPGYLMDFDLIFPHGYGEAISGAAREYDHKRVIPRMKESGESLSKYEWYLRFLQQHGRPTAGFGIGLERTVRYFCALPKVYQTLPYPKVPGVYSP